MLSEITMEEKLVELWPDYGRLYDVRSPDFKNRDKRQVAIQEIATKLSFFRFFGIFRTKRTTKSAVSAILSLCLSSSAILNRSSKFENRPPCSTFSRKLHHTRAETAELTALPGNLLSRVSSRLRRALAIFS